MSGIIDFHAHAFPDELAARAIPFLEEEGNVKAFLNGTITGLLASMDRAGVEKSLICSIATKPAQFQAILDWSKAIRNDRIIPLPSIHPQSENIGEELRIIREEGFVGIKMHPYYQEFSLDEDRMDKVYEGLIENNLLAVMHTGFDIAFPRNKICDPDKIVQVLERYPELRLITTHLGAWDHWDKVRELLIGKPIYMEISFALDFLPPRVAREMIIEHPAEYILFGSDSPWSDQKNTLDLLRNLDLAPGLFRKITRDNAQKLLNGLA